MNRIVFAILIMLVLPTATVYSQTSPEIEAFSQSRQFEANMEYSQAASILMPVYSESSYDVNLRLGWLNYKLGKYDDAMNYYRKAINLMPYSIEPKLGYNLPASAAGKWDEVIDQYKKILEIDPQNSFVNYQLGYIYYGRKEYSTALPLFEKVVNLYPFSYDGVIMYAWTNYMLGSFREAKVMFEKALMITPGSQSALEGLNLMK
jgi:tetratricopeptide (TPR) repeat protein